MNGDWTPNYTHLLSLSATKSDNVTFTYGQILKQPDAYEFVEAMMDKISDHTKNENL